MGIFNKFNQQEFLKEESDTAFYISKLEEIREKASNDLRKKIEKEIKLAAIGEFGEKNIAFELKNSGIPMYIIHDIYLEYDDMQAQIDYIAITRNVIFIIECKNLIGNIEIDNSGNFIRSYELFGKRIREGIYSPITQNQRHLEILKEIKKSQRNNRIVKMLLEKSFVERYQSIVVLANPKTILNTRYAKKEIKEKVIRADQLVEYIKRACGNSRFPAFTDKEMRESAENLLKLHVANHTCYTRKYEKYLEELQRGESIIDEKDIEETIKEDLEGQNKNQQLMKELKVFRLTTSKIEKNKPYYIFNDKQLMDLINRMPSNRIELQTISGFGPIKIEKYGTNIINILDKYRN